MSVSTQSIYNTTKKNQIIAFITTQTRTRVICNPFQIDKSETPDDLHPVDRIGSSNTFIIDNTNNYIPPKQTIIRNFEEYLQQINEYDRIMLANITILDMSTLIENITKEKKIIICSDGSTKENESGGAFVISDGDERILVTGHNPDTVHK